MRGIAAVVLVFLLAGPVLAQAVRVVDGDTLRIGDRTIRLLNIDAPEMGQTCRDARGRDYRCGERSAAALKALVAGASVACSGGRRDAYDRILAKCSAHGRDIGAEMVRQGMAVAFERYSREYVPQQVDAFKAGRGLWAGDFTMPWEFRETEWTSAAEAAPRPDCPIKGNISRSGERIYHTPYSRHYARTRINERRGERWFCNEAEARAAGWRAPGS